MNFDPWKCETGLWTRHSGGIDFLHPQVEMIHLCDIADSLSRQCRWGGHVPISVAEHCLFVAAKCDSIDILHALLHDSAEAYLRDIPTPLKRHMFIGKEKYEEVEGRMLKTIYKALGVEYDQEAIDRVLACEKSLMDYELILGGSRSMQPNYWASCWLEAVENAIFLSVQ